jgi:ArsR family transcriptional regulator
MSYVCDIIKDAGMTYSKIDEFEKELQDLAKFARVLSHPARLAILKYLAEQKVCISGDISNQIPLSRTTVSQHLQELKSVGLIQGTIDGVKINYCVDNKVLASVCKSFSEFFSGMTGAFKCNC